MIDFDALVLAPCMAAFGEDPSLKPVYTRAAGGVGFEVDGVFDDAHYALVMGADGDPEMNTVDPVMGVRLVQFNGVPPVQNDTVYLPRVGKTFMVIDPQPDGKGWVFLRLQQKLP